MNGNQFLRRLVVFGAACCLTVCLVNTAQAAKNVLRSEFTGIGDMQGKVQYVMHNRKFQTFSACMAGMHQGQTCIVTVRRNNHRFKMGSALSDVNGTAILEMSTAFGHPMPYLRAGDIVEVWMLNLDTPTAKPQLYFVVMKGKLLPVGERHDLPNGVGR